MSTGLNVSAQILTAYGLALLLSMMLSKGMAAFLFLGFLLSAYLGLSITSVSLFAVVFAFILSGLRFGKSSLAISGNAASDYDPLEEDE